MFTYKKNNIVLIILLTLSTLAFSEELKIREDANMRISPNKNSEVIEVLSGNTDVHGELSSENENWYKIEYNDKIGYVHKSLVTKKA